MKIEKNYLLSNNQYIHIHECEEGIDYTVYDSNGELIDGGILTCNTLNLKEEEILSLLSEIMGLKELADDSKKEIPFSMIEEFEERNLKRDLS